MFDTTNAIDVGIDMKITMTQEHFMRMLWGLRLLAEYSEYFPDFSEDEIRRLRESNDIFCEYSASLQEGSKERLELDDSLRDLVKAGFGKSGNARLILETFPNIHPAISRSDISKRKKGKLGFEQQGW